MSTGLASNHVDGLGPRGDRLPSEAVGIERSAEKALGRDGGE